MTETKKSKRRASAKKSRGKQAPKPSARPAGKAATAKAAVSKASASPPSNAEPNTSTTAAQPGRSIPGKRGPFAIVFLALVLLTAVGLIRRQGMLNKPPTSPSTATPKSSATSAPRKAQLAIPTASSKAVLKVDKLWFNRAQLQRAIASLESHLRPEATRSQHPWALAHGLIAFGKDLLADNQKPAVEVIALAAEPKTVDGRKRYLWPRRKGDRVVAPHRNMHVATMLEIGVPLDRWFRVSDDKVVRFDRLVRDAIATSPMPKTNEQWHDSPWLLSTVLNARVALGRETAMAADKLYLASLERLENDSRLLDPRRDPSSAFALGSALRQARDKGETLWAHSCGGFHLVQSVFYGKYAVGDKKSSRRIDRQLRVLAFRFRAEGALYAAAERAAPENLMIRVQQLKFLGHLVESLTLARKLKLYPPGSRLDQTLIEAVNALIQLTEAFERARIFKRLDEVRTIDQQTYLDLVGDGCHALRAMRRALLAYDASQKP